MKIVTDHGWPKASDGTDASAFDAFKNERDYIAQGDKMRTTVAAMDWAAREIERLRKIETVASALKFAAYPAHGSGFVMTVAAGNINDLEAALKAS